jgi:hypothetical protein
MTAAGVRHRTDRQGGKSMIRKVSSLLLAASIIAQGGAAKALTADEAKAIAEDAYIFGYSLISVEMSRKVITNVEKPGDRRAPMGSS